VKRFTVKDAVDCLNERRSPFEKTTAQKPKLSEAINSMAGKGNGSKETQALRAG